MEEVPGFEKRVPPAVKVVNYDICLFWRDGSGEGSADWEECAEGRGGYGVVEVRSVGGVAGGGKDSGGGRGVGAGDVADLAGGEEGGSEAEEREKEIKSRSGGCMGSEEAPEEKSGRGEEEGVQEDGDDSEFLNKC